jgi:hypothetical protein
MLAHPRGLVKNCGGLLASPALGEGGHCSLARRLEAMRRRAVAVLSIGERPHPRRALRCGDHLPHPCANRAGRGVESAIKKDPLGGKK